VDFLKNAALLKLAEPLDVTISNGVFTIENLRGPGEEIVKKSF
jgi:hypothetical protein